VHEINRPTFDRREPPLSRRWKLVSKPAVGPERQSGDSLRPKALSFLLQSRQLRLRYQAFMFRMLRADPDYRPTLARLKTVWLPYLHSIPHPIHAAYSSQLKLTSQSHNVTHKSNAMRFTVGDASPNHELACDQPSIRKANNRTAYEKGQLLRLPKCQLNWV
jgi:hypothetical protein